MKAVSLQARPLPSLAGAALALLKYFQLCVAAGMRLTTALPPPPMLPGFGPPGVGWLKKAKVSAPLGARPCETSVDCGP